MGHKSLINNTAYEVTGGRTLINGTAYEITGGRTLVDDTEYDIKFFEGLMVYDGNFNNVECTSQIFKSGGGTSTTTPTCSTDGAITTTGIYTVNPYNPDVSLIWFYILFIGLIDVTDYTTLHFQVESGGFPSVLGLSKEITTTSNYNSFAVQTTIPVTGTPTYPMNVSVDITNNTGEYYIKFYCNLSIKISKIWLE